MADEPIEDDALELTEVVTDDDDGSEALSNAVEEINKDDDDGEETVVTFGDEELPEAAPAETDLIKHLRNELRESKKALAEVRKATPVELEIVVGKEPDLESCGYDEDVFRTEYRAWVDRGRQAEKAKERREQQATKANEEWAGELRRYEQGKAKLGFADVKEVEDVVTDKLDQVQQSILVMAADNPALVLYSLGKHPAKLADIAKIQNPVKLAAAIVKLEGTLKVTTRRKAPAPDEVTRGSAGVSAGSDKTLEKLEKEAERTGNRTALIAYRRKMKK